MGTPGVPMNKVQILYQIGQNKGIITKIAKSLGCSSRVIYDWQARDEDVANAIKLEREQADKDKIQIIEDIKDTMYDVMMRKLQEGDTTCVIYALKSFGGHSDGSGSIKFQIVDPCDSKGN